jgi:hypothetical protein
MKLYQFPFSSNCQKVIALAHELNMPLELATVDLFKGEARTTAMLAKNKLPVLEDEDFVLWESTAMLAYLAAKAGRSDLAPTTPRERAEVDRWNNHRAPARRRNAFDAAQSNLDPWTRPRGPLLRPSRDTSCARSPFSRARRRSKRHPRRRVLPSERRWNGAVLCTAGPGDEGWPRLHDRSLHERKLTRSVFCCRPTTCALFDTHLRARRSAKAQHHCPLPVRTALASSAKTSRVVVISMHASVMLCPNTNGAPATSFCWPATS